MKDFIEPMHCLELLFGTPKMLVYTFFFRGGMVCMIVYHIAFAAEYSGSYVNI